MDTPASFADTMAPTVPMAPPIALAPSAVLADRTDALVALFRAIAHTRMAGVPIMHPALQVEAVGFEMDAAAGSSRGGSASEMDAGDGMDGKGAAGAVGVLITPWFMNLVWFPLQRMDDPTGVGRSRPRRMGSECFDFIGGHEAAFGAYEACSLFSPMFEFADHAAARATADAVLTALRPRLPAPLVAAASPAPQQVVAPARPARRAFLLGRRTALEAAT